jgi:ferric enterobactin receptor
LVPGDLPGLEETVTNTEGALLSRLSTVRNFTNNRETGSIDWNLDLKKKFEKEGHELDFMLNSSYGRPVSYYILTLADIGDSDPTEGSESNNPGTNNTTTASVDYVLPLNNNSTFEAGLKGTFNDITSSVDVNVFNPSDGAFIFDPLQSYDLGYTLNVYAAYLSTGFRLFNWLDFKPGIRYEYSDISIDYPGASVSSYGTLVPSVLLSHNFTDKKSMQLTYTRRIRRPDYGDLNPFINRSDPYNIQMGNVLLRPEVGERIELSYNTGFSKGGNLRLTLAQRIDSREIGDITTFYPEYVIGDTVYRNVSVTTNANIGSEYSSGLNIFTSIPVTSKLNLRSNMGLFHTYLSTDRPEGSFSTGFRFRGNLNATWRLPHELMLEGFGFWRSGGRGLQGREPPFYIYNLALRKLFWDDKGSIGVTATNFIRRDIRQVRTITTGNSFTRSIRYLPFRSFGISLTYRFGNTQSRPDRDDEMDSFSQNGN